MKMSLSGVEKSSNFISIHFYGNISTAIAQDTIQQHYITLRVWNKKSYIIIDMLLSKSKYYNMHLHL